MVNNCPFTFVYGQLFATNIRTQSKDLFRIYTLIDFIAEDILIGKLLITTIMHYNQDIPIQSYGELSFRTFSFITCYFTHKSSFLLHVLRLHGRGQIS